MTRPQAYATVWLLLFLVYRGNMGCMAGVDDVTTGSDDCHDLRMHRIQGGYIWVLGGR